MKWHEPESAGEQTPLGPVPSIEAGEKTPRVAKEGSRREPTGRADLLKYFEPQSELLTLKGN